MPAHRLSRAQWQLDRLGTIGSIESQGERAAEPLVVGEVVSGESRLIVHTSSLQGIYTMPFDQVAQIIGRDPVTRSVGEDGSERITGIRHYWRVFQRNIPDYDSGRDEAP